MPKTKRYGEEEVVVVVVVVEGETGCRPYEHGRGSHALQVPIYRIHQDETAVVQAGAPNSVKKSAHLGPSNEGESSRETRAASRSTCGHLPHLAREGGSVKAARCG
jgi:hypothetical protein